MLGERWRGWCGALTALLVMTPVSLALAQNASLTLNKPPTLNKTTPKLTAIAKPAKPAPAKIAAKKPESAHPTKKLAASPVKPKAISPKLAATAKKPVAAPQAASVAPLLPSYTVTTTRGDVTYTTTRLVPLPATPHPTTVAAVTAPPPASHGEPNSAAPAQPVTQVASVPASPAPALQQNAAAAPAQRPAAPITATPVSLTSRPDATSTPPAKVALPLAANTVQPANQAAATSFVDAFLKDAFHIARLDGANSLQRRAQLADLFATKMDVRRIAGYTTADGLTATSTDIQQRFRTILISYLVETYYPRLELASDPTVAVDTLPGPVLPDGTAVVWTTFTKPGISPQSVKWHLIAEGGGFKIVDIFSAGASLVQMERDTFLSVMRDGGISELMAKLDARTKALAMAATE
jgi:ABC-type transporter MlaC component